MRMKAVVCRYSFFSHLSLFSVIREVGQIHNSPLREVLNLVHIGLSILNMHIDKNVILFYTLMSSTFEDQFPHYKPYKSTICYKQGNGTKKNLPVFFHYVCPLTQL